MNFISRYTYWLHTRWPAGTVEKLPEIRPDGTTNVPGVRIVGDLTGIPLLKFSADSGARAVQAILQEPTFRGPASAPTSGGPASAPTSGGPASALQAGPQNILDLAIIGGGISGIS